MKKSLHLSFFLLLLVSACAGPDRGNPAAAANGIEIYHPEAGPAKTGEVSGAFMSIVNAGQEADRLLGASSDVAAIVEVHETSMKDGVMSMQKVDVIEIPAGQFVELKHGSYHIMLINLTRDLAAGDVFEITLQFERAGEIVVPISVAEMP